MPGVYLTDFGLAKDTATGSKYTRSGTALGTPAYMSPEQARGEVNALTPASDTWALGTVLHELFTGEPAFQRETPAATIGAILTERARRLHGVPPQVEALVAACLAQAATARPPNAAAVRDDADRLLAGQRVRARPPRRRAMTALAAATVLVVCLGGGAAWWLDAGAPTPRATGPTAAAIAQQAWAERGGDPEGAIAGLQRALQLVPDLHHARLHLGLLHWSRGETQMARTAWGAMPAGAPLRAEAEFYIGLSVAFSFDPRTGESGGQQALPFGDYLYRRSDAIGRRTRAMARIGRGEMDAARAALGEPESWIDHALLALAEERSNDPNLARGLRHLALARRGELTLPWIPWMQAHFHTLAGDDLAALEAADRAVKAWPGYVAAHVVRAQCLSRLDRLPEALAALQTAQRAGPRQGIPWRAQVQIMARHDRIDEAHAAWERARELGGLTPKMLVLRATIYERAKQHAQARRWFERALRAQPDYAHALAGRGRMALRLGEHAVAAADFSAAIASSPRLRLECLQGRSRAYFALGRLDEARADAEAVLAVAPDDAPARTSLARVYYRRGDYTAAHREYSAATRSAPGNQDAWFGLALAHEKLGARPASLAAFERAVELNPEHLRALIGLSRMRRLTGRLGEAEAPLQQALELAPESSLAWQTVSAQRLAQGRLPQALAALDAAIRHDPGRTGPWSDRGAILARMQRWAEAERDLHQALKREPGHRVANENLTKLYYIRGALDNADTQALTTLRHHPQSVEAQMVRVSIAMNRGQLATAVERLTVLLAQSPGHVIAWHELARVHIALKQWPQALAALERMGTLRLTAKQTRWREARLAQYRAAAGGK